MRALYGVSMECPRFALSQNSLPTSALTTLLLLAGCSFAAETTTNPQIQVNLDKIFQSFSSSTTQAALANKDGVSSVTASTPTLLSPATTEAESVDLTPKKPQGGEPASCKTDDMQDGVCVLYYQCDPETHRLITDGRNIIDVRIEGCPHYLDVCCLPEKVNTTELKPIPTPAPDAKLKACGYSNFNDDESYRIQNDGNKAEFMEYPWMIAVLKISEPGADWSQKDYLGGGSLIHPKVVLTAAHKIDNIAANKIKCRAGEWDTQTSHEVYPHQERDVEKAIRHQHFYRASILNSVALLVLKEEFKLYPNVGMACLGRVMPPRGTRCYGMGWGKDDFNSETAFSVILKKVELPLYSRDECQTALRRTRLGTHFQLHPSLTCAGGEEGRDTCGGDGGSPLVCHVGEEKDLRYAVFGMVAYGLGCGRRGVPGVYVNVPEFHPWVEEKMKAEGLQTDSYTI